MPLLRVRNVQLSYSDAGRGPAILLIQGAGAIGETWRPQIDVLSRSFRCISFDNRGIGGSELPPEALTIETMAGDALALMDTLGISRFHVAGHSMGGLIAQELALRAPHRVSSLSLLCTFAHGPQGARFTLPILITALRMRIGTRAMRRNAFTELVMPASYLAGIDRAQLAEALRPLFGHDLAEQPSIAMAQVRAMGKYDAADRLHALRTIPTLVVSALEDRIAEPRFGRELSELIPGARFVEIPGAGHAVTIQLPAVVNELLSTHIGTAEASASTAP